MKTLNRPMFRYGGPIKEGVMNGIREPKQNGGTIAGGNQMGMPMGNRTGFADPVNPGYLSLFFHCFTMSVCSFANTSNSTTMFKT